MESIATGPLRPVLVTISGNSLVFSRKIITSTDFYRYCAPDPSAPVVVKNQSPRWGPRKATEKPRKSNKKQRKAKITEVTKSLLKHYGAGICSILLLPSPGKQACLSTLCRGSGSVCHCRSECAACTKCTLHSSFSPLLGNFAADFGPPLPTAKKKRPKWGQRSAESVKNPQNCPENRLHWGC